MPEHSSWLSLVLHHFEETLSHNAQALGTSVLEGKEVDAHGIEPLIASAILMLILVAIAFAVRGKFLSEKGVEPEEKLSLSTFVEVFFEYFYGLAKDVMDAERAKKYFPIIAASASFVFIANVMALLPGMPVATSHLSITAGTALVVFVAFNIYGLAANGMGYILHLAGPAWYLAPLIFPLEVVGLIVRPITLAVRLMMNMAVDHLILGVIMGIAACLLPLPLMFLGCIVVVVQTLVFTLLTTIYIGLSTEHEAH